MAHVTRMIPGPPAGAVVARVSPAPGMLRAGALLFGTSVQQRRTWRGSPSHGFDHLPQPLERR
ncbi:predicted protein [Streptomyces filamentosus NRRL 15998]|uniref:Predicted protein n=1 Tax=Streptomyces filamentosus NRRL 15998 TaxID=457431 RepID=D6AME3_STRFL|nr:predicted protein [Streptomyces filamentosus NRRL 15998]